jgi:hypothetical protein
VCRPSATSSRSRSCATRSCSPVHFGALPVRVRTSRCPASTSAVAAIKEQADRAACSASSSCSRAGAHAVRHLRAGHHAVHHGVDHHADPHRGDPQAGAVAAAGRGRAAQDHAVDPLPHDRPSPCCRAPASSICSTTAAAPSVGDDHLDLVAQLQLLGTLSLIVVLTLTAGTALLMWMGELITQRGIGNGMSLLIFASVVSQPSRQLRSAVKAENGMVRRAWCPRGHVRRLLIAIVFIEQGQRRIPVQFAKRQVGRRMYGGQSTYIPLKVNQRRRDPDHLRQLGPVPAGAAVVNVLPAKTWVGRCGATCRIDDNLVQARPRRSTWPSTAADHRLRLLLHGDPVRPAQAGRQIRKQGGFIPGIRPGPRPSATWPRSSTGSPSRARCSSPSWRWRRPSSSS